MHGGATRIRRYGLSPAAYTTHKYLEAFEVLEVVPAVDRREDRTCDEYGEGVTPRPHRFRVHEEGFNKEAVSLIMATLTGMSLTKADLPEGACPSASRTRRPLDAMRFRVREVAAWAATVCRCPLGSGSDGTVHRPRPPRRS